MWAYCWISLCSYSVLSNYRDKTRDCACVMLMKMHVLFLQTLLRMLWDVKFCHKNVIKPVLAQNCQFGNFLTALGKRPLLIALSHTKLGRPAGRRLPAPTRRCNGLFRSLFRMLSGVKFCHKNVMKPVLVQNCQLRGFLTALGKCQLLIALSHNKLGRPAGRRFPAPIRRCTIVFFELCSECFETSNLVIKK